MNSSQRIDELSRLTAGLSQSDSEALALRLNPREKRVYEYLRNHGDVCPFEIRRECDIGNISSLASRINHKLHAAGLDVRMVCFV